MLSDHEAFVCEFVDQTGLNTPFGARCFLTEVLSLVALDEDGLNAPFGARCFLTNKA